MFHPFSSLFIHMSSQRKYAYFTNAFGHTNDKWLKEFVMKKIIFVLCLILASSLTVLASSSMYKIGETIGHAADFDGSILHLIGEAVTYDGREDVLINIANAPIYNLQTGFRVGKYNISRHEHSVGICHFAIRTI